MRSVRRRSRTCRQRPARHSRRRKTVNGRKIMIGLVLFVLALALVPAGFTSPNRAADRAGIHGAGGTGSLDDARRHSGDRPRDEQRVRLEQCWHRCRRRRGSDPPRTWHDHAPAEPPEGDCAAALLLAFEKGVGLTLQPGAPSWPPMKESRCAALASGRRQVGAVRALLVLGATALWFGIAATHREVGGHRQIV